MECVACISKSQAEAQPFQGMFGYLEYHLIYRARLSEAAGSAWKGITCQSVKLVSAPDYLS